MADDTIRHWLAANTIKADSTCWSGQPDYVERLEAENAELRAIVRDLLTSYLASFGGNKDELALKAECLLKD